MILYFADRKMRILGQASTNLPKGVTVIDDKKIEDTDTDVATFECTIPYINETRENIKLSTKVGNYILRSHNGENEFYTIIDSEYDSEKQEVYIYAEDAGLDLLNEIVGEYKADKAYPISFYIEKFTYDSGFKIGINEVSSLARKLSWDGEATATERVASVATQFSNCEVAYRFEVKGLEVIDKYIDIYKKRGKDTGEQLRLNKEISNIRIKESIANLATGLEVTGGTPENSEKPITLKGYKYDDGDIYVSGTRLYSREALKKWSRYTNPKEPNQIKGEKGHITKKYSYDTTSQSTLCAHAVTELKKLKEIEVNYDADIKKMPKNIKIGDRVNIIDDDDNLYLNTRLLILETSVCGQYQKATLGEHIIKTSGIDEKIAAMAKEFAENSLSAKRAQNIANAANEAANAAKGVANEALEGSNNALTTANEAKTASDAATQSAQAAQEAASNAQTAVEGVENSVAGIEETVNNAQAAAEQARQAAITAESTASEAKTAAENAVVKTEEAKTAAVDASEKAEIAVSKAETATGTANIAKEQAEAAKTTAEAAKLDAEQAEKDVTTFGESLESLSNTMSADYARKTDLTETAASLQTQITQNAGQIESTAKKVVEVDETANNAAEQAEAAQTTAAAAQAKADQATADATAAQTAADNAAAAATAAQSEADKAKAAAETAKGVADKAETDLAAAKADLETVTNRVGATEEEIAAAQAAVDTAQAAADKAKTDAATAAQKAAAAQSTADTAVTNAEKAQNTANDAVAKASTAQAAADAAKGDAAAAQATADEAKANAATAKSTADTAKANAAAAQTKANEAAAAAGTAQAAADDAAAKVTQAQTDLDAAKQNLIEVSGKVDATKEEVEAAEAAVALAQAAADKAKQDAAAAQSTADTAKQNAQNAQNAANTAKTAADNAQKAADDAQDAADAAQAAVDSLAVRVTSAETQITQNAELIKLAATKEEVTKTLGGYYTAKQTDAAIKLSADGIKSTVSSEVTEKINDIEVGGRNLALNSNVEYSGTSYLINSYRLSESMIQGDAYIITVWGEPTTGKEFGAWTDNGSGAGSLGRLKKVSDGVYAKAFTCPTTTMTHTDVIGVYDCVADGEHSAIVKKVKVEKGNKATDWTPAPEDMATADGLESANEETGKLSEDLNTKVQEAMSAIEQLSDSISMLVVDENGSSLMEQTSNGWVFSMGKTLKNISDTIAELETVKKDLNDKGESIESLNGAIGGMKDFQSFVSIDISGPKPILKLGNSTEFSLQLTSDDIEFLKGSDVKANIDHEGMNADKINVRAELRRGKFIDVVRENGNVGTIWKEE